LPHVGVCYKSLTSLALRKGSSQIGILETDNRTANWLGRQGLKIWTTLPTVPI